MSLCEDYEDIIHLPHHISLRHPPMSALNRAAQFSPFAALNGYEDAIRETGRLTQERVELTQERREELDRTLAALLRQIGSYPEIRVTWFVPDERKAGGSYVTAEGRLKKVDGWTRELVLTDGQRIDMDEVFALECIDR